MQPTGEPGPLTKGLHNAGLYGIIGVEGQKQIKSFFERSSQNRRV